MKKTTLFFFQKRTKPRRKSGLSQLLFLLTFFSALSAYSQGPGCPNVDAGADIELDCTQACTDLTATFLQTGATTSYEVSAIDYAPPFPSTGGTPVSVSLDDRWSDIIPLPFTFCFYGQEYNEMLIGSNAVVTFDTVNNQPDGTCDWSFSESIPNTNLFFATIFGPYMDIDPSEFGSGTINYTVFGDAPCRTMVINFPEIPYYFCTDLSMTTQIVIYETTNVVEVYLENRSDQCPTWNSGNAVLGIQNQDGTDGIVAPGRQTGNWATSNEAWRFTPNGASNVEFAWLNDSGDVISTDPTINVCPPSGTTVYTAQVTYTNCNGDVVVETDDVAITLIGNFSVDLGGDQELCDASSYDITATVIDGDPNQASYLWNTGETTQTITVTTSGDYTVEVTIDGCTISETVSIIFGVIPLFDLGENFETCFEEQIQLDASPSNIDPTLATYQWSLDGTVIAGETNPTLVITQEGEYTVEVTLGNCVVSDTILVTLRTDLQVALEDDFETCFEEETVLTPALTNIDPALATYQWSLDGTVIAGETNPTLVITQEGEYTVEVTLGDCVVSDTTLVTLRTDLQVALEDDFLTCPNEPITLTASTSENDVTYQWMLNDEIIANETSNTLELVLEPDSGGVQTYTVVITKGECTGSDDINISLYPVGNCIISQGLSPNGSPGYNDTLDLTFLNDRTGIAKLQIFNRLGVLVFEQVNYTNQWRGQDLNNNDLPAGAYFYVIDLLGDDPTYGNQATGWIYLNQDAN